MSTHSTISVVTPEFIYQIYCHFDGYISHNGEMLVKHYNTPEKALEMVLLGDMSCLKERTNPSSGVKHTFENPEPNVSVYYGRDRGEKDTETKKFKNIKNFVSEVNMEDFNYIFNNDKWYLITNLSSDGEIVMSELEELLQENN